MVALAAATWLFAAQPADAQLLFGITKTTSPHLVSFDSAAPGTLLSDVAISGLATAVTPVGLDRRPSDGKLYMLTINTGTSVGQLWTVDPYTGESTLVATLAADPSDLTSAYTNLPFVGGYDIDFNPVPDRLRVVNSGDANIRVNPNNGLVTTDTDLNFGGGDEHSGADPAVTAIAYTNSTAGVSTTSLFGYDFTTNELVLHNPPNNGTLNTTGGGAGVVATGSVNDPGMDISPDGVAFLYANVTGTLRGLFSLDLSTGAATLLGQAPRDLNSIAVMANVVTVDPVSLVDEAGGTAAVVTLHRSSPISTVAVNWAITPGTAGSADFSSLTGAAAFAAGETTTHVQIPLVDDTDVEGLELATFSISATPGVGDSLVTVPPAQSASTLVISSGDVTPTPDTTKPVLFAAPAPTLTYATFLRKGISFQFSSTEAVTGAATAKLGTKTIGVGAVKITTGNVGKIVLKPSKLGLKLLKAAKGKRMKIVIGLAAKDAAGNSGSIKVSVVLTR